MKKKGILLFSIVCLVIIICLGIFFIIKHNHNTDYVYDNQIEQSYIDSSVYVELFDMSIVNQVTWIDQNSNDFNSTINKTIKSSFTGFFRNDILDKFVLTKDGQLFYSNDNIGYKQIADTGVISKIGFMYGKTETCDNFALIIAQLNDTSNIVIKYDSITNSYIKIDSLTNYINSNDTSYIPICYKSKSDNILSTIQIISNGNLKFVNGNFFKDKKGKNLIKVNYIIYTDNYDTEKYYVISNDNKLYIIDSIKDIYNSVAIVNSVEKVGNNITINLDNDESLKFTVDYIVY